MPESLYEVPRANFSQGDILTLVPHVYLEDPLTTLITESNGTYRAGRAAVSAVDDKDGQPVLCNAKRTHGVILSPDCEIDKPQLKKWIVCPIMPLHSLKPENQDRVKRNRIYSMLFLPKYREILPDSFVNFSQSSTISSSYLQTLERIVSLSDEGRRALYVQFLRWQRVPTSAK